MITEILTYTYGFLFKETKENHLEYEIIKK